MLRRLMDVDPERLEQVADGRLELREAAQAAGLVKEDPWGAIRIYKLVNNFKCLNTEKQCMLLWHLWRHTAESAQERFIEIIHDPEASEA